MGTKVNNNDGREVTETLAMTSKPSPLHRMKQKALQEGERAFFSAMMPSISKHRYSPSPRRSPVCVNKCIANQGQNSQSNLLTKTIDLPPLVRMEEIGKFNIIIEDEDNNGMLARSHRTKRSNSFASEDTEDFQKYEYGLNALEEESGGKQDFGEASMPMIVDQEDEKKIGNTSLLDSSLTSPSSDNGRKAFCPIRVPRRSSFKRSDGSLSPASSRRASFEGSELFEVVLPGQRIPIKRQRSITFNNKVDVQKVEPARLLAANPQSLWFQENEYETIKIKTLALLDKVESPSGVMDGKKYCTRGLEKFMEPEVAEIKKHQAWDSVLNEQFLQRKDGEFDEESLANIYRYSTKRSQTEATRRASLDAETAAAILQTNFSNQSKLELRKAKAGFGRRMSL